MKKIVLALVLGIALTACDLESDPTKDTQVNFKNTQHKLDLEEIDQQGTNPCISRINFQIPNTLVFEPGQNLSAPLIAHVKNNEFYNITTQLVIDKDENSPSAIGQPIAGDELGEYAIPYNNDPSVFSENQNFAKFTINVRLDIIEDKNDFLAICKLDKEVSVYIIKSKNNSAEGE